MSQNTLENNDSDKLFKKLDDLYGLLVELEFFGDFERCEVRWAMADAYPEASMKAALAGGYETEEGDPDPSECYPDEVFAYLESNLAKEQFNETYKGVLHSVLSNAFGGIRHSNS